MQRKTQETDGKHHKSYTNPTSYTKTFTQSYTRNCQ